MEREGKIELRGRRRGEIEKIEELQDIKKIVEEEIMRKRLEEEPEEVVESPRKSKGSEKTDNEKALELNPDNRELSEWLKNRK